MGLYVAYLPAWRAGCPGPRTIGIGRREPRSLYKTEGTSAIIPGAPRMPNLEK